MMEDYDAPEWGDCSDCEAHHAGFGQKAPCATCSRVLSRELLAHLRKKPQHIVVVNIDSETRSLLYPDYRRRQQLLFESAHKPTSIDILRNTMWAKTGDIRTKCPDNYPDPFHPTLGNTKNLK